MAHSWRVVYFQDIEQPRAQALTVLANILVCFWEENYGEKDAGDKESSSMYHGFL